MEKIKVAKELKSIFGLILASVDAKSLFKMILAKTVNWDAAAEEFIKRDNAKHKDKYQIELNFKKDETGESSHYKSVKDMVSGKVRSSFKDANKPQQEEIEQWLMLALFMPQSLANVGKERGERKTEQTIQNYLEEENKIEDYSKEKDILTNFRSVVDKGGDDKKERNFAGYLTKSVSDMLKRLKNRQSYRMQLLMENGPTTDDTVTNLKNDIKELKRQIEKTDNTRDKEKLETRLDKLEKRHRVHDKRIKQREPIEDRSTELSDSPYGPLLDVDGIADVYEQIDSKKYDDLREDIEKYVEDHVLTHMSAKDAVTDREKELADVATRIVKLKLANPDLSPKDLADKLDEKESEINNLMRGVLQRTMRSYSLDVFDRTGNEEFKQILDRWKWVDFGKKRASLKLGSILGYLDTLFIRLENTLK